MKQAQFETLLSACVVDEVIAHRSGDAWECQVHGDRIPSDMGNRLKQTRGDGGIRTWASLDTLHRWVRDRGWTGRLQVEN